jgi:hypothetical protein
MIFYHGTTLDAARQIQKQGLVPHRETAYDLIDAIGRKLRDMPGENRPYIYLDIDRDMAQSYAKFRAAYERADYQEPIDGGMAMRPLKLAKEKNPNAKPAVISFDVPSTIARKFKLDMQEPRGARVCLCMIPPKYITSVTEVR